MSANGVPRGRARLMGVLLAGLVVAVAAFTGAVPASAHEGEESGNAADLVLQAIALIVNRPGDTDATRDRIEDAIRAEDVSGVDLAFVEQAGVALAGGDLHQGRALLEQSIGARPHINVAEPPPIRETTPTTAPTQAEQADEPAEKETASGAEPAGEFIVDPLDVGSKLDGGDWALLVSPLAVGLAGIWLGLRYRPRHGSVA